MKYITTGLLMVLCSSLAPAAGKGKPLPANDNLKTIRVVDLDWHGDLATALALAAKEKKNVFIDFTGVTCTNCKINEKTVFPKPEVRELLEKYVRVQLFADTVPEAFYKKPTPEAKREKDAEANLEFQNKTFGTEQLPLYVIVKPDGDMFLIIAKYEEGRINQVGKFVEFLKQPLR